MNGDNRGTFCRWVGLVLATLLLCIPARAQSCDYEYDAVCYSVLTGDGIGNLMGVSVTEVPFPWLESGYGAYAEGVLTDGSGYNVLDDVEAYDEGGGYAEANTYAAVSVSGTYLENGYHYAIYDYGLDDFLGETQASTNYVAVNCDSPTGESSTYTGVDPTAGLSAGDFTATLSPYGTYYGSTVWENVTQGTDGCWYQGSGRNNPFNFIFTGNATWDVDYTGLYGPDTIGVGTNATSFYQNLIATSQAPYTSCALFVSTQVMSHSCTGNPYKTNELALEITAFGMTAFRDTASGPAQ